MCATCYLKGESLLASGQLLTDDASEGNHGQATVVELPGLTLHEVLGVGGLEAKRIETKIAGRIPLAQSPHTTLLVLNDVVEAVDGVHPAICEPVTLSAGNGEHDSSPEDAGHLLEVVDAGSSDLAVEQGVEVLTNRETEDAEHRHAPVSELRLAVELDLVDRLSLQQVQGIEIGKGCGAAGHAEAEFGCRGWGGWGRRGLASSTSRLGDNGSTGLALCGHHGALEEGTGGDGVHRCDRHFDNFEYW
mmetsp:Transcript_37803/g.63597  ORF Transcript_37803/g.63597 Transcript_37803/m.63597 type:complete len:247 (+) Transcript_37803:216-956(+)